MFEKMKEYKEEHGHLRTHKRKYHGDESTKRKHQGTSVIRNFQAWQRKEYKKLVQNEKSEMTPERIRKLQDIGFEFIVNPRRPSSGEDMNGKSENVDVEFDDDDSGPEQHDVYNDMRM
uniref:Helicase-associated domain-containing protein n=1 Tax=Odontella aurita TaxID=265563 RepID=A0A7S4MZT8_9STRA|mmetsp:Transcript_42043/g.127504  ORF Transcript_42043/g.127504 Transcript_42043/m.127504 type:complete len:118 (+) Transcript_42043:1027-1380(+)